MPTYDGKPACECLAAWLPIFEATIGRSPHWFQLVGDAPASAGFHRSGGSADSEPLSDGELRIARNMGAAAWNRWWTDNYHAHLRLNDCPHNSIGQPQVADLNAGRDGTGPLYDNAGVPDNGPRDGVHWPLRTWREGIEWANELQEERDMATYGPQILELVKRIDERDRVRGERRHKAILALLDKLADDVSDNASRAQVKRVRVAIDALAAPDPDPED